jgi:hypothetical protein
VVTFLFRQKRAFRYPVGSRVRTAVLAPWFRSTNAGRVFPNGWSAETARYSPEAVAGTREQLLKLEAKLTHATIVLVRVGDALLTDADRELLWRRFRVPIFEQIIGADGELLAAECEAHDGLHVENLAEWTTGYRLELSPCACGKKTPRLQAPVTLAAAS